MNTQLLFASLLALLTAPQDPPAGPVPPVPPVSPVAPGAPVAPVAQAGSTPQYRYSKDLFPGETYWTEAVGLGDIDNDGDLDVMFARGEGWNEFGKKHQNGLYLNQQEKQPLLFADASVERLGYAESHARDVVPADVDGDGFLDLLYANGFNTAPPFLHMNRGATKPGFFRLESDRRGLTEALSSASADFGDVDNDGDLDLVISDTGPEWADLPGGRPRLYVNDGRGMFVEEPAKLPAGLKTTHMGVNLSDLDGDFDLDFFGSNKPEERGLGHYLMQNDGSGKFQDAAFPLPETTGAVYEADDADLDGDGDEDLFFTSLAKVEVAGQRNRFPFGEGPMRSLVAQTGELRFEIGTALGQDDDNDLVFLDTDQDGDLDVIVGSLGPREKLHRNLGDLKFEIVDGVIEPSRDPSLDIGVGDLDGDGDLDLVTANGLERIGSKQPPCGAYLNDGPKDAHPPTIQHIEALADPSPASGPFVFRVRARDDSLDDGRTWMKLDYEYEFAAGAPSGTATTTVPGVFQGGSQWRCAIPGPAPADAKSLTVRVRATDSVGNVTRSDPRTIQLSR